MTAGKRVADATAPRRYRAVVIGTSAGGLKALSTVLSALPTGFPAPVMVVQHRLATTNVSLAKLLDERCSVTVKQAEDRATPIAASVYIAPPGYHLLIETDRTFSLSVDPPVRFARPAIDVLFETAAEAYGRMLIGIVLTGASRDGATGLRKITTLGGYTIVQDPATAHSAVMPQAAIAATRVDRILPLDEIAVHLTTLCRGAVS